MNDTDRRAELERTMGRVLYSDLRAHLVRGALFLVSPAASLLDCAIAVASDDVTKVQAMLTDGTLRRPTEAESEAWNADLEHPFESIVVQPYVLAKDLKLE